MPKIVILATGGTIAGSAPTQTQAGYTSGQVGVETLIAAVPQIKELADISGEQIASVGSQDMSDAIWLNLATRLKTLLALEDVDGVVITHGTDTIEETAYFLHLTLKSNKPVVMTAAMRPATALSADGPLNIYNAVAADPKAVGRGVMVVINDDIHGARAITKTSTTDVQTFMSPDKGLIGTTLYGKATFYRKPYAEFGTASAFSLDGVTSLPRVDVLYMHADFSADLVAASVNLGAKGIISAGVGNGNTNAATLEALTKAAASGVIVVRSTRVPFGTVGRNIEVNDDEAGTIASAELNPAKSRVLLKLALLTTQNTEAIQELFNTY
jgi:L-asparaginase